MMRVKRFAAFFGILFIPAYAWAFCGFYVGGAGAELFNNATQVVLMREGNRTVLSMQNNYQGPPENFAMVIPVPVVLQEENVKTLDSSVFNRIDKLDAPRLVEYWERDPCSPLPPMKVASVGGGFGRGAATNEEAKSGAVVVEAQFVVGEYEIVILSAKESTALDEWLRQNNYNIPEGAEPVLRPYVESGMKFFVAKVDVSKVTFENGQAILSPLRVEYDSQEFSLPVRLGLLNASGKQDLIIHILSDQRYEAANYKNVTIPTNINLAEKVKDRFGEFYVALFDKTLEKNPGAIVTEYSWDARSCDPCPSPPLSLEDLNTLGADVLPSTQGQRGFGPGAMVLTRLHTRYSKETLQEDLVFQVATPIAGGREFVTEGGKLEEGAIPYAINNFQGRYAIRHPWKGKIECENPQRGVWEGPPENIQESPMPQPAQNLALAPRGKLSLVSMIRQDIPEIDVSAEVQENPSTPGEEEDPSLEELDSIGGGANADTEEKKGFGGKEFVVGLIAILGLLLIISQRER